MLVEKIGRKLNQRLPEDHVAFIIKLIRVLANVLYCLLGIWISFVKQSHRHSSIKRDTDSVQKQGSLDGPPVVYGLSIIIPVFNASETIKRCLDSVIDQAGLFSNDFQLIVVDDGSTDTTKSILQGYETFSNIKIYHKANGGLSSARNFGISHSRGRYIYFLDSDDFLLPGALKAMFEQIKSNADLIQFSFRRVRDDLHHTGTDYFFDQTYVNSEVFNHPWSGYPWAKLIKAQLMFPFGFPEGYWFEDTVFPATVFPRTKTYITSSSVVQAYVDNPEGITRTSRYNSKTLDHVRVLKLLFTQQQQLKISRSQSENEFWQAHLSVKAFGRARRLEKTIRREMLHEIHSLVSKYPTIFKNAPHTYRSSFLLRTIESESLLGWTVYSMIG